MRRATVYTAIVLLCGFTAAPQQIDLAQRIGAGTLRPVNREVTALEGTPGAVHVSAKPGNGVVWIEGSEFTAGTLAVDVRGKNVPQRSFLGLAFHRTDDNTYEAVYLRPFNFRADNDTARQHAIQYISVPEYDWPRLRKEFPEEFENPVDPSVAPTDWVPLRLVVTEKSVQVYVGGGSAPALEVRRLGSHNQGLVGLWVGNNSDGDFRNLRVTATP